MSGNFPGYFDGNGPRITLRQGERVRWYLFSCHMPGHFKAGMRTLFVVRPAGARLGRGGPAL
jgi:hypothetical protein